MIRKLIFAAVSVLFLVSLVGCGTDLGNGLIKEYEDNKEGIHQELSELWDGFLEEINDWSESFATHSITKDHDLIGNRENGVDNYVGTYEAAYTQFNGEEYIFGGASLKRKEVVTCTQRILLRSSLVKQRCIGWKEITDCDCIGFG